MREQPFLSIRPDTEPETRVPILAVSGSADREEGERELPPGLVDGREHLLPGLSAQIAANGGLEDDRQCARQPFTEQPRKALDRVSPLELWRVGPQGLDRPVETIESCVLVGPDEGLEQQGVAGPRHVERSEIDPAALADAWGEPQQLRRNGPALLAGELELRAVSTPRSLLVVVAVAIPDEVEARAGPDLDQIEGLDTRASGDLEEAGKQQPAALNLVRLDALRLDEATKPVAALLEHRHGIAPGIETFAQREVVKAAEQL